MARLVWDGTSVVTLVRQTARAVVMRSADTMEAVRPNQAVSAAGGLGFWVVSGQLPTPHWLVTFR